MKIKNIVFSGFAAVILMGTVGANAATTPAKIASQEYVDAEIAKLSGANGSITTIAGDVATLKTTVGDTALTTTAQNVTGAINELDSAIDTKVNVSDKATSIRTVSGGASDDKWATEKAVATFVEGITGGTGTVSQQIANALGDLGTGNTTVEDALADKQNSLTPAQLDAVNSGATSALIDKISTNESAITALQTLTNVLNGYNTCITQQNGSGHCVLTASSGGLSWVNVSRPFEVE